MVEGRVNGRVRRITLGRWPVMPWSKPAESPEMKASIADGYDPTTTKTEAVTFKG